MNTKETIKEITTNDQLIVGEYYYLFDKQTGRKSIGGCGKAYDSSLTYNKYIGANNNYIWAEDDNNQALRKWRIFPVTFPTID